MCSIKLLKLPSLTSLYLTSQSTYLKELLITYFDYTSLNLLRLSFLNICDLPFSPSPNIGKIKVKVRQKTHFFSVALMQHSKVKSHSQHALKCPKCLRIKRKTHQQINYIESNIQKSKIISTE